MATDPRVIEASSQARMMSRIAELERRISQLERRPSVELTVGMPVTTPAPGSMAVDVSDGALWIYMGVDGLWSGWRVAYAG